MSADALDRQVRLRAFDFLSEQTAVHGEVLSWSILSSGFLFDGKRVPLIGPQGIFKPAVLPDMPISIVTAPVREGEPRPYDDGLDEQGLLSYRYRGTNPRHRDNVGLRLAMQQRAPLIYLFGVVKGEYMPVWPVFIVGDDPSTLTFKVAIDDRQLGLLNSVLPTDQISDARRSYVTALTVRRLHQTTFRMRVLNAYRETCAICRLRHRELLEAAHILPDGHPRGEPIVPNGLALCKLHHAAFDACILEIKWSDNRKVGTSLSDQLGTQYLLDGQRTHGVYLVGWCGSCSWTRKGRRLSRQELPPALERQAKRFCRKHRGKGVRIEPFILEAAWRDDAAGGRP